jgi:hypothetical protein
MKTFFDVPTQVFWKNPDFGETDSIYDSETEYFVGIAYKDEIICACCGGIFEIEDVAQMAGEDGIVNPIYEYNDWVDIAGDICGGEMPEGMDVVDGEIVEVVEEDVEGEVADEESAEYEAYYYKDLE